ncbi:triosephosphate isomerase (TIM) [Nematocida sp. LUAm3]|nr:triosephosphate isomerase (TIM) [Nematocida sp. LUAm3]KAI5174697.1 triosephosphate isomerase (TIM) [Nematocida sp. LUAm2]KAI5177892.1 triosephosphate isomerase (TIM) [Nematocida sp. LUAm1]
MKQMKSFIGNWKMNGTKEKVLFLSEKINQIEGNNEVGIAPPFTLLEMAREKIHKRHKVFAQSVFPKGPGAYTGGVGIDLLKDAGVNGAIVGHSERAIYFKESLDESIEQMVAVLSSGLEAIMCIGEKEEEKEKGETQKVLEEKLRKIEEAIEKNQLTDKMHMLSVAYEPLWAIGTGKVPGSEEIKEVCLMIKDPKRALRVEKVLYGGSVSKKNIHELLRIEGVDGFLIGGASLTEEFIEMCNAQ